MLLIVCRLIVVDAWTMLAVSYKKYELELLKEVGGKIRRVRERSGWSQEKLSFESSLHRTYVSSVERGQRNVSVINLCRLAGALRVLPSKFLKDLKVNLKLLEKNI